MANYLRSIGRLEEVRHSITSMLFILVPETNKKIDQQSSLVFFYSALFADLNFALGIALAHI